MILIGIGSNLPWRNRPPLQTIEACLARLARLGIETESRSRIYRTAALGSGRQASYLNLVVRVKTSKPPAALLSVLHQIEREFGRSRGAAWAARTLDLDLLAYHDAVLGWTRAGKGSKCDAPDIRRPGAPIVPHPMLHMRPFVVVPLMEIAPDWHHPVTGETGFAMWRRLKFVRPGRILGAEGQDPVRSRQL